MHKLFDLATLWEHLPMERRNPIDLVKIKNVTRRTKEAVVLSPEQFPSVPSAMHRLKHFSDYSRWNNVSNRLRLCQLAKIEECVKEAR